MEQCVYVLHFDKPYKGKLHYVGYSKCFQWRMAIHTKGTSRSAKILKAVKEAGIGFTLVKIYPEKGQTFERWLKNKGGTNNFCPICRSWKYMDSLSQNSVNRMGANSDNARFALQGYGLNQMMKDAQQRMPNLRDEAKWENHLHAPVFDLERLRQLENMASKLPF